MQATIKDFSKSHPYWIRLSKLVLLLGDVLALLISAGLAMVLAPWLGEEPSEWLQKQETAVHDLISDSSSDDRLYQSA